MFPPFIGSMQHVWQDWLPLVVVSINSSICSSIRQSLYCVLFGTDMCLSYDMLSQTPSPIYSVNDYVKKQTNVSPRIHAHITGITCGDGITAEPAAHPNRLVSGDVVMKLTLELSFMLSQNFFRPSLSSRKFMKIDLKEWTMTFMRLK